ncbi:hypothetical protein [Mesorhizobium sp. INR15]|uniref:hypothetical protein n=1 Tax=Mesorhizobium sp. INR15 TaxID=2654248 RepID=UPI00189661F3|nr:hypothetical protein [Mesorhizobium sp. INR15]QPC91854.1 hypothetical protein GA829_15355 [Mesorhizobium sp. INR15]
MSILTLILRELVGMFIDDEFLAIAILAVVAVAAVISIWLAAPQILVGGVLLIGCVAVVMASALRASRKDRKI